MLGTKRVELLTREFVPLRFERDAKRGQFRPIRVEARANASSDISLYPSTFPFTSRAVSGRRSAIRNATSDSWRMSLSASATCAPRAYRIRPARSQPGSLDRSIQPASFSGPRARGDASARDADATGSSPGPGAVSAGTPCPCASSRGNGSRLRPASPPRAGARRSRRRTDALRDRPRQRAPVSWKRLRQRRSARSRSGRSVDPRRVTPTSCGASPPRRCAAPGLPTCPCRPTASASFRTTSAA